MALNLALTQSRDISLIVPQGVSFTFGFTFNQVVRDVNGEIVLDADDKPVYELMDITDMEFLSQIRDEFYDNRGKLVIEFTDPPVNGNTISIDVPNSSVYFTVSQASALLLKTGTNKKYYFETKLLSNGVAIRNMQAIITVRPDIARPEII